MVFVGDCMEEDVARLCHAAGELGLLGVPAFMFHEGQDPVARKAFEDSVGAWKQALSNDATKQATIDACKMSPDAAKDGFAAQGC